MKRQGPLLLALGAALLLRLPLFLLPGPGRDEAAYFHWAWHPELFYAPLLQGAVRLAHLPPLPGLWALRLPSLVAGLVILILVDRLQRRAGAPPRHRALVLLAVALCEWQTFTGSVLHPDGLFTACLLGASLAAGRPVVLGAMLALAALAKPTGLLLLPAGWVLVGRGGGTTRAIWMGRGLLALALLFLLPWADAEQLAAMARFGRMDPSAPWPTRWGAGAVALLFAGGPLLLLLPAWGAGQRWKVRHHREEAGREARVALGLAAVLLAAFAVAAVSRGQIKSNWVLPAALLLLPRRPVALPRPAAWGGLALAAAFSLATGLVHHRPSLLTGAEEAVGWRGLRYRLHAGTREARVSPTASWAQHVAGFADLGPFARRVEEAWRGAGGAGHPEWILADDYGLASQLAWEWHGRGVRIVLVGDGIQPRGREAFRRREAPGPVLLLGVQTPVDALAAGLDLRAGGVRRLEHPVTGTLVEIAPADRRPPTGEGP